MNPSSDRRRRFPRTALLLAVAALILVGAEYRFRPDPPPPGPPRKKARSPSYAERWRAEQARRRGEQARNRERHEARKEAHLRALAEAAESRAPATEPESRTEPQIGEEGVPVEALALTRIVYDEKDPEARFAVIRGRAVRAGETTGGFLVFAVERDRVLLGVEGEIEVRLPREEE